jgi:hypothetical protein
MLAQSYQMTFILIYEPFGVCWYPSGVFDPIVLVLGKLVDRSSNCCRPLMRTRSLPYRSQVVVFIFLSAHALQLTFAA